MPQRQNVFAVPGTFCPFKDIHGACWMLPALRIGNNPDA
jgi:hypothetical protein